MEILTCFSPTLSIRTSLRSRGKSSIQRLACAAEAISEPRLRICTFSIAMCKLGKKPMSSRPPTLTSILSASERSVCTWRLAFTPKIRSPTTATRMRAPTSPPAAKRMSFDDFGIPTCP
jgi:hypothetical protein